MKLIKHIAYLPLSFLVFALLLMASCTSSNRQTLYIFAWSDLIKPELITEFEQAFNCHVVIDTYDSNESMYAKLKLSSVHYDIIFPSNYYVDILQSQSMIQPIDRSQVPNINNFDPNYFKDHADLSALPFIVSFSGIAYRQDKLQLDHPSWDVFSRTDLKGRMTMLNDGRETIGAALKYLGFSINSRSADEITQATDILISWKKNLAKFESEQYKNGLASGEFLVAQGYSIDIMQVITENPEVAFAYPIEGAILSIDCIAIPTGATETTLAHAFINFMLDTPNAAENVMFTKSLMPLLPVYDLLDTSMRQDPILFPPPEDLKKMELIQDLQGDIQLYYKAWNRVKSG